MNEIIQRIGLQTFIRLMIECWNELFLLFLIFNMQLSIQRDKSDELINKVKIPLSKELLIFYCASFLYNLCEITIILFIRFSRPHITAAMFFYYLIGGFQTFFFLQVIKDNIAVKHKIDRMKRALTAFQLLQIPMAVMLAVTPFTDAIYRIDECGGYSRKWGFYVWQGVTILTFVFIAAEIAFHWKQTDSFIKKIILTASFFPMLGFVSGLSNSGRSMNNEMIAVAALVMFLQYEKNKTEVTLKYGYDLEKAKTELAETKLNLMQAQIKPHFINNAMIAVQEVCYTDPERAAELLDHFARYLRNNIDATESTEPIPFEEEVQAVREYLAIEHADTSKKFSFEFELNCTGFTVPALSIEPLAENAVKHGIDRYSPNGKVVLSSYETDDAFFVEIRDNGEGFDMNSETLGKGGIGLKNTEFRLKQMCGGRLEIKRRDNWTVAEIMIPKDRRQ